MRKFISEAFLVAGILLVLSVLMSPIVIKLPGLIIDSAMKAHIEANVPPDSVFSRYMKRDLAHYLSERTGQPISQVDFELLQDEPEQIGNGWTKFYVWISAEDSTHVPLAGAARVAAKNRERFEVVRFYEASQLRPDSLPGLPLAAYEALRHKVVSERQATSSIGAEQAIKR